MELKKRDLLKKAFRYNVIEPLNFVSFVQNKQVLAVFFGLNVYKLHKVEIGVLQNCYEYAKIKREKEVNRLKRYS